MADMTFSHRREALHLHAIGFTPSGIADELNAQFGTSYSRRSVLLELGLPEGARGRAAAAQVPSGQQRTVRFPAEAPPLDDGVPMSALGSVEVERRALRRVGRHGAVCRHHDDLGARAARISTTGRRCLHG